MPSNSYNINSSPTIPKRKKSSREESEKSEPHTSKHSSENGKVEKDKLENGKLENGKLENLTTENEKLENIDEETENKDSELNGILKKKISMGTITLNGVSKNPDKWKENYVPYQDSAEDSSPKTANKKASTTSATEVNAGQSISKRERKSVSKRENNESMAKKVTEIFQEVFNEERGNWGLKLEYYLSCIGVPIAFSSLWRFPQLIANYGGGAFLFAYLLLMLLIGVPIYFMETALAQFSQSSVIHVWRCIPVMQGVGIAMVIISLISSVYNSQIAAYSVHYFFASFVNLDSTILWGSCKNYWPKCYDVRSNNICSFLNVSNEITLKPKQCVDYMISSSRYYWEDEVLRLTDLGDVGKIGSIHWDLTLCVAFIWLVTFIFLAKGIKSSGKVALFTGFVPISILIAFFVYSVQKTGARKGLEQFYQPEWNKLANAEVWQKAAEQVIFSLCVTYGSIITFSSYKRFRTEVQIGAVTLTICNAILSVMSATMIFALYGALGHNIGIHHIKSLMETDVSGIEIVYVFVPEVMARLFPYPHAWSAFFFFMLLSFGLHAQFSLVETCLTAVYDALPKLRRRKYLAAASLILPLFLLSIPLSSSTGLHIHSVIGSSIVGPNILFIALIEILSLHCFYGVRRFSKDLTLIFGSQPSMFWKVCWIFVAPLTLLILLIFSLIDWERLVYEDRRDDKYWTLYLSWVLTLLPIAVIPLSFIFTVFYKLCVKEPIFQHSACWGPGCPKIKELISERKKYRQQEQEDKNILDGNENEAYTANE